MPSCVPIIFVLCYIYLWQPYRKWRYKRHSVEDEYRCLAVSPFVGMCCAGRALLIRCVFVHNPQCAGAAGVGVLVPTSALGGAAPSANEASRSSTGCDGDGALILPGIVRKHSPCVTGNAGGQYHSGTLVVSITLLSQITRYRGAAGYPLPSNGGNGYYGVSSSKISCCSGYRHATRCPGIYIVTFFLCRRSDYQEIAVLWKSAGRKCQTFAGVDRRAQRLACEPWRGLLPWRRSIR